MDELTMIREQIRHMRKIGVEPEVVYVSRALYVELGCPRMFMGVYVDCDRRLKKDEFEVR